MKPDNDNGEPVEVVVIEGNFGDQLFEIELHREGLTVWNITRMMNDAAHGIIGKIEELPMDWVPPSDYSGLDRAKIDVIKNDPFRLNLPVLLLAAEDYSLSRPHFKCFADGSHRITARQELKLPTFFAFVISDADERKYRTMKSYRVKP